MSPRSRRIKPAEPPKIQLDIHAAHGAFPLPLTQLLEADLWKALSANAKAVLTPLCNYHRQPPPQRQRSWPRRGGGAAERRHRREPIAAIPDHAPVDRRPERDGPAVTLA
jgi:hypothetical protein